MGGSKLINKTSYRYGFVSIYRFWEYTCIKNRSDLAYSLMHLTENRCVLVLVFH